MKTALISLGVLAGLVVMFLFLTVLNFTCGAVNNASTVAKKEFYPDALLKKYEWFKNAAAELDKKQADISVYQRKISGMREEYKGQRRSEWDRTDKESINIWEQELAGIKASYNSLAAEYNAQMVKFNWKFCNVGDLPPGSSQPLPREFKPYIED